MTIGAMKTHKVLFAIFVLIDPLFVGLALSTWGIMRHTMHNLAAYSELFISLLAFYASAASVLNTHFGQVVLPVGELFGRFKKIKQDNPDDTFLWTVIHVSARTHEIPPIPHLAIHYA